jgi:hypothetical protein
MPSAESSFRRRNFDSYLLSAFTEIVFIYLHREALFDRASGSGQHYIRLGAASSMRLSMGLR